MPSKKSKGKGKAQVKAGASSSPPPNPASMGNIAMTPPPNSGIATLPSPMTNAIQPGPFSGATEPLAFGSTSQPIPAGFPPPWQTPMPSAAAMPDWTGTAPDGTADSTPGASHGAVPLTPSEFPPIPPCPACLELPHQGPCLECAQFAHETMYLNSLVACLPNLPSNLVLNHHRRWILATAPRAPPNPNNLLPPVIFRLAFESPDRNYRDIVLVLYQVGLVIDWRLPPQTGLAGTLNYEFSGTFEDHLERTLRDAVKGNVFEHGVTRSAHSYPFSLSSRLQLYFQQRAMNRIVHMCIVWRLWSTEGVTLAWSAAAAGTGEHAQADVMAVAKNLRFISGLSLQCFEQLALELLNWFIPSLCQVDVANPAVGLAMWLNLTQLLVLYRKVLTTVSSVPASFYPDKLTTLSVSHRLLEVLATMYQTAFWTGYWSHDRLCEAARVIFGGDELLLDDFEKLIVARQAFLADISKDYPHDGPMRLTSAADDIFLTEWIVETNAPWPVNQTS